MLTKLVLDWKLERAVRHGPDTADIFRRSASYVDCILKGEKSANLPAQSPNKFELVVNLKSAKALDLSLRAKCPLLAPDMIFGKDTSIDSLADHAPLKLGKGARDLKHQLAGWRGGVDRLLL